jgi:peptidoglycan hydrolase CwlO-like protein
MFPELVKTDNSGIKSIDYGRLTSVLIEGIKEQQKEIDSLKEKSKEQQKEIDSLRQEIENLKNQLKR